MSTIQPTQWDADEHARHPATGKFIDMNKRSDPRDLGGVILEAYEEPEWDWAPPIPQWEFQATSVPAAVAKVEQANAKLEKLGIEERFTYETEYFVRTNYGITQEMARFTLNRPSIKFEGWSFTGAHDFTPTGEVVSHLAGDATSEIPEDNHCDHCGSTRARDRVYTINHPEKGTMQVGKSCLKAFLGMSPVGLWTLESDLELDDVKYQSDHTVNPGAQVWDVDELLIAALAQTNDGAEYISRDRATFEQRSTGDAVALNFTTLLAAGDSAKRRRLARSIVAWAKKLDGEPGTYEGNLKSIFSGKREENYVRKQHFGLAVSVVSAYHRAQQAAVEKKVQEQAPPALKSFIAPKDTKLEGVDATVEKVISVEVYDPYKRRDVTKRVLTLRTPDGHLIKWWGGGKADEGLATGQSIRIKAAIVKDNEVYRDEYQTVVKNVRLEPTAA
ncbi:hypothetical protein [Agromyces humi]|uniref:hypothetical protein n=1 Tax=Agromyces humi TaxID=1766800 RepID=UPI00135A7C0C|nr:hypothetical protein [Agromyces humi]